VPSQLPSAADLLSYAKQGVNIVAPPTWALVQLQGNKIAPSQYVADAKAAGRHIITWTLERSGTLTDGGGFYYQTIALIIKNSGDTYELLESRIGLSRHGAGLGLTKPGHQTSLSRQW
jgi:glycerophosphoryl diester phosphodiesterase